MSERIQKVRIEIYAKDIKIDVNNKLQQNIMSTMPEIISLNEKDTYERNMYIPEDNHLIHGRKKQNNIQDEIVTRALQDNRSRIITNMALDSRKEEGVIEMSDSHIQPIPKPETTKYTFM